MPKTIKVLSIDGGGIRGIIPALILAEIEKRTGKPIATQFDLIAGTSTGGILALALTRAGGDGKPCYSAERLVGLYEDEGARIFARNTWHRIHSVGNLRDSKYPAEGVEAVLAEYFENARLSQALTDVIITSYEIERRVPWFFKSRKAKANPKDSDFLMKDVARATSAAPTYFDTHRIETGDGKDYYALVDGGVYANNPAMCGYVEALTMFPDAERVLVVSLGTGELTRRLPYEDVRNWGLVEWAQPLLSVMFDGVSDTVDYQLRQILATRPNEKPRYFRFQTILYEGNDDMDDAGRTNLRVLKLLASEIVSKESAALAELCGQLA